MAIDGLFIYSLIKETKESIINTRLERIVQINDDIFSFSLYHQGKRIYLNFKLKPPYACYFLTNNIISNDSITSNFLNNLKRHLEGYIIKDIYQNELDRVITFELTGIDIIKGRVNKKLVLELMGRYNNLILIDEDFIVDAYTKNISSTSRSIVNKIKYEFFPSKKLKFTLDAYNSMTTPTYLSDIYLGISPLLSEYLFKNKIDIFNTEIKATKNLTNNKFYWFDLFSDSDQKIYYKSISELLEKSIETGEISKLKYQNFIEKNLTLYSNRILKLKERLANYYKDLELKDFGNYIYSAGINLNEKHSEIISYDNTVVKLDVTKTLLENAKDYFNKYQKAKRAISHIETQIEENQNLYDLFNQYSYDLSNITTDFKDLELSLKVFGFKTKQKVSNKKQSKDPYIKLEYLGNTYYIGRNSKENIIVTHEIGSNNDLWLHIKDQPGSHVVMKGIVNDDTLLFGAMLAGYYSKEKDNPVVSINYTQIKHLKKIPKMPLSQVILTKYQTINIKVDKDLINRVLLANNLK